MKLRALGYDAHAMDGPRDRGGQLPVRAPLRRRGALTSRPDVPAIEVAWRGAGAIC